MAEAIDLIFTLREISITGKGLLATINQRAYLCNIAQSDLRGERILSKQSLEVWIISSFESLAVVKAAAELSSFPQNVTSTWISGWPGYASRRG